MRARLQLEEHHKFTVDARVKFIGVARSEHPLPGTITALINQYTDTVVDGHTYGVVNPVTGIANPFNEPMYQVRWDDKRERLPIMSESELVLESSIFVHFYSEADERIIEAQFIDSPPAVKSDVHLEGQWWEIVDLIEPLDYRYSPGLDIWKAVLRLK